MDNTRNDKVLCKACGNYYIASEDGAGRCPRCGSVSFLTRKEQDALAEALNYAMKQREKIKKGVESRRKQFRRFVLGICGSIILLILIFVVSMGYISSNNRRVSNGYEYIEKNIKEHEYTNAYKKISEMKESNKTDKVTEKLEKYEDSIIEDAMSCAQTESEKGDFDKAIFILQEVYNLSGNNRIQVALKEAEIKKIEDSLKKYDSSNDLAGAMSYLNSAKDMYSLESSDVDIYLQTYLASYLQQILGSAKQRANEGDYLGAIAIVETATSISDDPVIQETITEYRVKMVEQEISSFDKDDLPAIIKYLDKEIKDHNLQNSVLISLLNTYSEEYKQKSINEAEEAYNGSGYKEAAQIIQKALELIPEDKELKELYDYYCSLKPTALVDMHCYDGNNLELFTATDNMGETHTDCVRSDYGNKWFESAYKLDGKYKQLSVDLFMDDRFKQFPNNTELKVYTDDSLIFTYDSKENREDKELKHFDIDVTGATSLRIAIRDNGNGYGTQMIMRNVMLYP